MTHQRPIAAVNRSFADDNNHDDDGPNGLPASKLAEELQKLRPGLRTLLISGYTDNFDAIVQNRTLAGKIWFLQKPFGNDLFGGEVRSILDREVEQAKGA